MWGPVSTARDVGSVRGVPGTSADVRPGVGCGAKPQRASASEPILDTSTKFSLPPGKTPLAPDEQPAFPLTGAQIGLDRLSYNAPRPTPTTQRADLDQLDRQLGRLDFSYERDQLAFRFARYARRGVQLTFGEWQTATADAMAWLDVSSAKTKRIERFRKCGAMWTLRVCKDCGHCDVKGRTRAGNCEHRICSRCARVGSRVQRRKLEWLFRAAPLRSRGLTWWFYTLTVPTGDATNVASLMEHYEIAWRAWQAIWGFLRRIGARGAYVKIEVSPGGMVHLHPIVRHVRLTPAQLRELHSIYRGAVPGGKWVKVKQAYGGARGVAKELAKYLAKGVASDKPAGQTPPMLSAMIESAFFNRKLVRIYGDVGKLIKGAPQDASDECGGCGATHWGRAYFTEKEMERFLVLDAEARAIRPRVPSTKGPP